MKTAYNHNGIGFYMEDVRAIRTKKTKRKSDIWPSRDCYVFQISFAGGGWITIHKEFYDDRHEMFCDEANNRINQIKNGFQRYWDNFKNNTL